MRTEKLCVIAALSCLFLASCGGGDGHDAPNFNPDRSLAQGFYDGTITFVDGGQISFNQQTIALENGEYFIVYGQTIQGVFFVDGVQHGTGQIVSGTSNFQSSDLNDYFFDRNTNTVSAVYNGQLNANFSSGSFFNGSETLSDSDVTFAGNTPAASVYNYNTTPGLANIVGTWTMRDLLGSTLTLTIAGTGSFTGSYASGCTVNGSLTPRASGKNIFNMTMSFGPTPCSEPSRTFSGIAYDTAPSTTVRSLTMAGVTADFNRGNTLYGTR